MNTYIITKKDGKEVEIKAESMRVDNGTVSFVVGDALTGALSLGNHDVICVAKSYKKATQATFIKDTPPMKKIGRQRKKSMELSVTVDGVKVKDGNQTEVFFDTLTKEIGINYCLMALDAKDEIKYLEIVKSEDEMARGHRFYRKFGEHYIYIPSAIDDKISVLKAVGKFTRRNIVVTKEHKI